MKDLRVVWSTVDAGKKLIPFLIVEFNDEDKYEKFMSLTNAKKCVFLSVRLENKVVEVDGYELKFPPYYNEYNRKNLFWYNNVFESFEEAFERLLEEKKRALEEFYTDDEEGLEEDARLRVEERLQNLPVVRIK